MKTYMFPGQGSQAKGMGQDLFDKYPELVAKADEILGYSIKELCLEDPRRELNKTQFTQPALYVVNALSYYHKIEENGEQPDFFAGHSLGEYNALLAAGCLDFETGLKLVKQRGELMSQAPAGAMAAILNASKDQIETILKENKLENIDLANYNTPSQIVISGTVDEIAKAQACFQEGDMLYYPLNTSGAFHSRFMEPVKEKYAEFLKAFEFSELKIPVISNATASPYKNEEVLENLATQLASCVKWCESIQFLMNQGSESGEEMEFEEIGHGDVLTKIVNTIKEQTGFAAKDGHRGTAEKANTASVKAADNDTTKDSGVREDIQRESASTDAVGAGADDAEEKVRKWNQNYPVGTKVKSLVMEYDDLETRTEAVLLFGHRAAVYMQGYNGYFDLDEVRPL